MSDEFLDKADAVTPKFEKVLTRDALIGYLKNAQRELGIPSQKAFGAHLGVTEGMVRKAYSGKATIDTLCVYLTRCDYKVLVRPVFSDKKESAAASRAPN